MSDTNASGTPRTDKAWNESSPLYKLSDAEKREVAAQLERELADKDKAIAEMVHRVCKYQDELAAERAARVKAEEVARELSAACGELNGHASDLAIDVEQLSGNRWPRSLHCWNERDHSPEKKWGVPIIEELTALKARAEAAEKDKRRLDELQALLENENDLDICKRDDGYHINPIFDQEKEVVAPTLRKVIDAAIERSK